MTVGTMTVYVPGRDKLVDVTFERESLIRFVDGMIACSATCSAACNVDGARVISCHFRICLGQRCVGCKRVLRLVVDEVGDSATASLAWMFHVPPGSFEASSDIGVTVVVGDNAVWQLQRSLLPP